jgi:hypothetical protein
MFEFESEYMDRLVANILGLPDEYVSGLCGEPCRGNGTPSTVAGVLKSFLRRRCQRRMAGGQMPTDRL